MNEISFCVFSKNICLKDNDKTTYWVGKQKLETLDKDFSQKKNSLMT